MTLPGYWTRPAETTAGTIRASFNSEVREDVQTDFCDLKPDIRPALDLENLGEGWR
jgi:hypothetical protein